MAQATGLGRRQADRLIKQGRVDINGKTAELGSSVDNKKLVRLDGKLLQPKATRTILLNKPAGYVVSRRGQGSKTVYDLLPQGLRELKPVGRLDKDSSGLLLLTNDGQLAENLTHPSKNKQKIYRLALDKEISKEALDRLSKGVPLEDGISRLSVLRVYKRVEMTVAISEGRNRQIRRTLEALGYTVVKLHRTEFGDYSLGELKPGKWKTV